MGECAHWFEVADGQQYPKQALIISELCWRPSPTLQTMKQRDYSSGGPHWVAPLPADGQETEASPHRLTKIGKPRPGLLSHSSCRDLDRQTTWKKGLSLVPMVQDAASAVMPECRWIFSLPKYQLNTVQTTRPLPSIAADHVHPFTTTVARLVSSTWQWVQWTQKAPTVSRS